MRRSWIIVLLPVRSDNDASTDGGLDAAGAVPLNFDP
jgi:hypothetical protein